MLPFAFSGVPLHEGRVCVAIRRHLVVESQQGGVSHYTAGMTAALIYRSQMSLKQSAMPSSTCDPSKP
jgi:phosphate/sulfate permease